MANYEKTVLYIYPEIDKIVARVDEKFKERVFASRIDTSPALEQCNELVKLTEIKSALLALKGVTNEWLKKFSNKWLKKNKPSELYKIAEIFTYLEEK